MSEEALDTGVVAYFLAVQTGVIGDAGAEAGGTAALTYERLAGIAEGKALDNTARETFLRAVGCSWLVCLAVWMSLAATTVSGKILAIFFPMGFDHVVATMFFLPAAIFAGDPASAGGMPSGTGRSPVPAISSARSSSSPRPTGTSS